MPDGHSPWAVSDRLWARDRCYKWLWARVVSEDGEGAERELRIHFEGWESRYDETIPADSRRLRKEPPDEDESDSSVTDDSDDDWEEAEGPGTCRHSTRT